MKYEDLYKPQNKSTLLDYQPVNYQPLDYNNNTPVSPIAPANTPIRTPTRTPIRTPTRTPLDIDKIVGNRDPFYNQRPEGAMEAPNFNFNPDTNANTQIEAPQGSKQEFIVTEGYYHQQPFATPAQLIGLDDTGKQQLLQEGLKRQTAYREFFDSYKVEGRTQEDYQQIYNHLKDKLNSIYRRYGEAAYESLGPIQPLLTAMNEGITPMSHDLLDYYASNGWDTSYGWWEDPQNTASFVNSYLQEQNNMNRLMNEYGNIGYNSEQESVLTNLDGLTGIDWGVES